MTNLFAFITGVDQWLIVLVVVLILFGGKKIPELMRGVGKGVGELQKGLEDGKRALHNSIQEDAAPVTAPMATVATTPDVPAATTTPPATK